MKKLIILSFLSSTLAACSGNTNNERTTTDTTVTTSIPAATGTCTDPSVTEKIKEAISVGTITGMTEEEETAWLAKTEKLQPGEIGIESYSVDTLFLEHCILSVDAFAESMGAYPDSWHTYLNFDMRTGDSLRSSAFLDENTTPLIQLANTKLQKQIEDAKKGLSGDELETLNTIMNESGHSFTQRHLENYYLKANTITFIYPFEFPHVIRALEPDGNITFTAEELQPFLKKDGPLGYWIK